MTEFNVAVVLEDVELSDDVIGALIKALPDAVPSAVNGVVTVSSPVEADDALEAATNLVEVIRGVLPASRVVRLDQDLVSISDIATRTGRSRESVRLLVDGARGPGGFPGPVGVVGDGIRIWPWAVVVDWFREVLDQDLGERGIPPEVAAAIDAALAGTVGIRRLLAACSVTADPRHICWPDYDATTKRPAPVTHGI